MATRQIPFTVALREPVLGVTSRAGWLIEGDAGWAEWSPLPSWSREENAAAYRGAIEAADQPFPEPVIGAVEVNTMIPRVAPRLAARMAVLSGCATAKVKVGDPDGEARVRAVREAVGPRARIRVDANGSSIGLAAPRGSGYDSALNCVLLRSRRLRAAGPVGGTTDHRFTRAKPPGVWLFWPILGFVSSDRLSALSRWSRAERLP